MVEIIFDLYIVETILDMYELISLSPSSRSLLDSFLTSSHPIMYKESNALTRGAAWMHVFKMRTATFLTDVEKNLKNGRSVFVLHMIK